MMNEATVDGTPDGRYSVVIDGESHERLRQVGDRRRVSARPRRQHRRLLQPFRRQLQLIRAIRAAGNSTSCRPEGVYIGLLVQERLAI